MRRALIVAVVAAALTGCAARAPEVTPTFLALVATRDPGADPDELARGRALYVGRCAACHALPVTTSVTRAAWPRTMAAMARKSRLAAADERAALRYVLATWTVREAAAAKDRHQDSAP